MVTAINAQANLRLQAIHYDRFLISFGSFLRECRQRVNRSPDDVAAFLEVPASRVRDFENGTASIPLNSIYRLAGFLKISSEEIMKQMLQLEDAQLPEPFYADFQKTETVAEVISRARNTLGITVKEVVKLMGASGFVMGVNEFERIEAGLYDPTCDFWMTFCEVILLSADSHSGYSQREHLARAVQAVRDGENLFRITREFNKTAKQFEVDLEKHDFMFDLFLIKKRLLEKS